MSDPNRGLLERVVRLLAPMLDELVFVGGCAAGLMISDPAAAGIRPIKDVDVITNVTSYAMYVALANRLRAIGLTADTSDGAPACRWRHGDATVDIMPTDRGVLGFSNTWYGSAIASATPVTIAGLQARIVTPACFLATKLEAFHGRGQADVLTSSDLEDIVMLVDGRPQLAGEIERADHQVRRFIAREIGELLADRRFVDGLAGFLQPDRASQARRSLLEKRLKAIAALDTGGSDLAIL